MRNRNGKLVLVGYCLSVSVSLTLFLECPCQSGHIHFVLNHEVSDFWWQVISRWDDLLTIRQSVHSSYKDDEDAPEEGESSLESAGGVRGCEGSFKQGDECDEEEESGGSGSSDTSFYEVHVDKADQVHDQEYHPGGIV